MSIPTDSTNYPQDGLTDETCCWCGRKLKNPAGLLHLVRGGSEWAEVGDTEVPNCDLGFWPIGPECVKRADALGLEIANV